MPFHFISFFISRESEWLDEDEKNSNQGPFLSPSLSDCGWAFWPQQFAQRMLGHFPRLSFVWDPWVHGKCGRHDPGILVSLATYFWQVVTKCLIENNFDPLFPMLMNFQVLACLPWHLLVAAWTMSSLFLRKMGSNCWCKWKGPRYFSGHP